MSRPKKNQAYWIVKNGSEIIGTAGDLDEVRELIARGAFAREEDRADDRITVILGISLPVTIDTTPHIVIGGTPKRTRRTKPIVNVDPALTKPKRGRPAKVNGEVVEVKAP